MASQYTHDVVATNGEYKSNGETKKRYINVGKAFTDENGRISIKLDSVPVGPDWSGWLSLYEPKPRDGQQQPQQRQQATNRNIPSNRDGNQGGAGPPAQMDDEDEQIPF